MTRILVMSWLLRAARRKHPELFDSAAAGRAVEEMLREHVAQTP